jgi:hypothetical protein
MYCGGDVNAVDICNIHCKKNQVMLLSITIYFVHIISSFNPPSENVAVILRFRKTNMLQYTWDSICILLV